MTSPGSIKIRDADGNEVTLTRNTDPATNSSLQAIVDKLITGPATETTLAAVLAKLPASPATAAGLTAIADKLITSPATEATLVAVLNKITASGATEATLASILSKITASAATEATLAAILAKLITAPATAANQTALLDLLDTGITVTPAMIAGGNISLDTNATGASYVDFSSQACSQLTIVNASGTTIEFRQDGTGVAIPVFDESSFTILGITNANQISIRRKDVSNTSVAVQARWER